MRPESGIHRPRECGADPRSARASVLPRRRGVNERGVYVESDIERPIKLALMDAADQVVLVVDSGKFHRAGLVRLCGLDRVSTLVTDHATAERKNAGFTLETFSDQAVIDRLQ